MWDNRTGGKDSYIHDGDRVSEFDETYDGEVFLTHKYNYYPAGKIKSATHKSLPMSESDYPGMVYTPKYKYYPDEILKKSIRYNESEEVERYYICTPGGKASPSGGLYLMKHGLTVQLVIFYISYVNYKDPGVGSTIESFNSDGHGGFKNIHKVIL